MRKIRRGLAWIIAAVMLLTAGMTAAVAENRIWQEGDTGETVTWIQTRLKELKYTEQEPTGVFDEETRKALEWFQENYGLLVTGMADSVTMEMLKTATVEAWGEEPYEEVE